MTEDATPFLIGATVRCGEQTCGNLTQVVVDPLARALTHLVVTPVHHDGFARLVPLDLVGGAGDPVELTCTPEQFDRLPEAEETRFLPGSGYGYPGGQILAWPYFGLGGTVTGAGMYGFGGGGALPVTYDKLPAGEVGVRRGDPVHASDGEIGRVQGLVVDPHDRRVTHVLLQEGHLWGRKEVAIPMSAVAGVGERIDLTLTKQEVGDLPPVDLDRDLPAT